MHMLGNGSAEIEMKRGWKEELRCIKRWRQFKVSLFSGPTLRD